MASTSEIHGPKIVGLGLDLADRTWTKKVEIFEWWSVDEVLRKFLVHSNNEIVIQSKSIGPESDEPR